MTLILLAIFFWCGWEAIGADEDMLAAKYEAIWQQFLSDTGLEID